MHSNSYYQDTRIAHASVMIRWLQVVCIVAVLKGSGADNRRGMQVQPRLLLCPPKSKGTGIAAGALSSQAVVCSVEAALAFGALFH